MAFLSGLWFLLLGCMAAPRHPTRALRAVAARAGAAAPPFERAAAFLDAADLMVSTRDGRTAANERAVLAGILGLAALGWGALVVIWGLLRTLGQLGLTFDGPRLLFWFSFFLGGAVLAALGLLFGEVPLRERLPRLDQEEKLGRIAGILARWQGPLGHAALALGAWFTLGGLLV